MTDDREEQHLDAADGIRSAEEVSPSAETETGTGTGTGTQTDWQRPETWPKEVGGKRGPEPTRYGDWESNGRCTDF